jgi:hypothetical protein
MLQQAIPKVISMPGFFYIGRMVTPDVDLLPTHLRAKIKTNETGAGDMNDINGHGVSGHKELSQSSPRRA